LIEVSPATDDSLNDSDLNLPNGILVPLTCRAKRAGIELQLWSLLDPPV
jgi:hypothetical protein